MVRLPAADPGAVDSTDPGLARSPSGGATTRTGVAVPTAVAWFWLPGRPATLGTIPPAELTAAVLSPTVAAVVVPAVVASLLLVTLPLACPLNGAGLANAALGRTTASAEAVETTAKDRDRTARFTGSLVGPNDGSLTLGTEVVSPLDMATTYATLAARGLRCDPRPLTSITSPTGQPVAFTAPARCHQVLDPAVADTVTSVLEGVLTNGTGYPNAAAIGRPAAGKTGTNEAFSSAWFVGYTPQLSAAVELGDPRGGPTHPLTNITIGAQSYAHVFGGDIPALIWGRTMNTALTDQPYAELPAPAPATG